MTRWELPFGGLASCQGADQQWSVNRLVSWKPELITGRVRHLGVVSSETDEPVILDSTDIRAPGNAVFWVTVFILQ